MEDLPKKISKDLEAQIIQYKQVMKVINDCLFFVHVARSLQTPVLDLTWENVVTSTHYVTVETTHMLMASDRNKTRGGWMSQNEWFVITQSLPAFGHRSQSICISE